MHHFDHHTRSQWPSLLMALPARQVHTLANTLANTLHIEDVQLSESGLGLLTLRDSALGEQYFPGEIALARAVVRVRMPGGEWHGGAALILDDRAVLARSIAVLDAVLASGIDGRTAALALLNAGAAIVAAQRHERKTMLAATRVDFSLVGGDDDE